MIFLDNSRSCNNCQKRFLFVNSIENPARKFCAALVRETEHRPRARAGRAPQAGPQLQRGGARADSTRAFCRKRRCRAARWRPQYTMELRGAHPDVESVAEWPRGRLGYRDGPSVAASGASAPPFRRSLSRPPRVRLEVTGPCFSFALREGSKRRTWYFNSRAPCGRQ